MYLFHPISVHLMNYGSCLHGRPAQSPGGPTPNLLQSGHQAHPIRHPQSEQHKQPARVHDRVVRCKESSFNPCHVKSIVCMSLQFLLLLHQKNLLHTTFDNTCIYSDLVHSYLFYCQHQAPDTSQDDKYWPQTEGQ